MAVQPVSSFTVALKKRSAWSGLMLEKVLARPPGMKCRLLDAEACPGAGRGPNEGSATHHRKAYEVVLTDTQARVEGVLAADRSLVARLPYRLELISCETGLVDRALEHLQTNRPGSIGVEAPTRDRATNRRLRPALRHAQVAEGAGIPRGAPLVRPLPARDVRGPDSMPRLRTKEPGRRSSSQPRSHPVPPPLSEAS